jgi:hypothetical protein
MPRDDRLRALIADEWRRCVRVSYLGVSVRLIIRLSHVVDERQTRR